MATSTILINNNAFFQEGSFSRYLDEFTPSRVVANGWVCTISPEEGLRCEAVRHYSDGEHKMVFTISPGGKASLRLCTPPENKWETIKSFRISGPLEGTLGLSGGYIDSRYAYFRESSFQQFLDVHGITAVKHENPNQIFFLRNACYGGGECHMTLLTDGEQVEISCDYGRSEKWQLDNPMTCASEVEQEIQVTGATWVIVKKRQHERDRHNSSCILYTLGNPTKLVGLPKVQ